MHLFGTIGTLLRRSRRALVFGCAGAFVVALALLVYVAFATDSRRYDDPARVPPEQVAIVFGAGLRRDGEPSRFLAERVDAAIELYRTGRAQKLLMTGDNSRSDYDEVSAMQRYAVARGVAEADITLDYAGFRTYDSCFRARAIFGVTQAVLVTQQFHLARAVYTCNALGIDAVGLGTPDWGVYRPALMVRYKLRESLATLAALVEVHITRPQPTFLGPFEGIS